MVRQKTALLQFDYM